MKLKIAIIILGFLFFSCKKENFESSENSEKENNYKVISVLYHKICKDIMTFYAFPAPPPNPNISWDSIKKIMELDKKIEKDTVKTIDELIKKNGKIIVAIDSVLTQHWTENTQSLKNYNGYGELLKQFVSNKDTLNIDVSKITSNKYASSISYREDFKQLQMKGFEKLNINLSFSKVQFNKEKNKEIVIMGARFGKLNGFSAIYFLEKKKNKWVIKYEKGLSIS